MSLLSRVEAEIKESMLKKQPERLGVLRMLKSGIQYAGIEKGGADYKADDALVVAVVRKEIKKRQDSIESFEKASRNDLAQKEKAEVEVLNTFLPAEMSDADLEKLVKEAMAETGATAKNQMGVVMKAAQAKAAGAVDGKRLSSLVSRMLK